MLHSDRKETFEYCKSPDMKELVGISALAQAVANLLLLEFCVHSVL